MQSAIRSQSSNGPDSNQIPADAQRSLSVYNLLFPIALCVLLPGALSRMFRRGGFRAKFGQRLGRFDQPDRELLQSGPWIWIHSISVGETFIALKLARAFHEHDPQLRIALSTTTTTGFAEAEKAKCDWLVDALLGTGFEGAPREPIATAIRIVNSTGPPVFAVDIPSGMNADTGETAGDCILASCTATFVALKQAFLRPETQVQTGPVSVVPIGVPGSLLTSFGLCQECR